MRRKQLLAFLMVGALTVGMAPSAAIAASDETALSIEDGTLVEEELEEGDFTEELPEEPSDELPAETPEEPVEEFPSDDIPTETPDPEVPVNEAPPAETEIPLDPSIEPEATPTPEPEEKFTIMIGEEKYTSLTEAVNAAPEGTDSVTTIFVTGEIEIAETVVIPEEKGSIVIAATTENTTISRAAEFTGSMFQVDGSTFQLTTATGEDAEGNPVTGNLYVDGSTEDGSQVEGSIVEVTAGNFGLSDGVTLTGNNTTGNGGAINNTAGTVYLLGGTITGNQAALGGAVYSEGEIAVQGTVEVTGNIKTEGLEENNITLSGNIAVINVNGPLVNSLIGVDVNEPTDGKTVVALPAPIEGVTMADILAQIVYNGDTAFAIDENGILKATEVTPTPTPEAPLKLKAVSMKWLEHDRLELTFNSSKDGNYYISWVKKGDKAPAFDPNKTDGEVIADYDFTAYVTDLPEEEVDIYVCVQDNDGNHKALLFQPNYGKRPTVPVTPTPDHVPVIPSVKESVVKGLEEPLEFYPNTFYNFTVIGAGTQNDKPGKGDVKWIPLYWSTSSNPSDKAKHTTWKIGTTNGIQDAATYNLYVFFKKAVHDGTNWQMTDTVESATFQFKSKQIAITTATPTPTVDPYYNGEYGGDGYQEDYDDPEDYSDEADGETKKAVSTGDEAPVGNMMMLAMASLLAGGYVLVRRRKKEIE